MGGRFCSLDQTSVKIMQILSAQLNVDQKKKGLRRKLKRFFPRNQVKTKKMVFAAVLNYIRPEFVGFIRAGSPFFV